MLDIFMKILLKEKTPCLVNYNFKIRKIFGKIKHRDVWYLSLQYIIVENTFQITLWKDPIQYGPKNTRWEISFYRSSKSHHSEIMKDFVGLLNGVDLPGHKLVEFPNDCILCCSTAEAIWLNDEYANRVLLPRLLCCSLVLDF